MKKTIRQLLSLLIYKGKKKKITTSYFMQKIVANITNHMVQFRWLQILILSFKK